MGAFSQQHETRGLTVLRLVPHAGPLRQLVLLTNTEHEFHNSPCFQTVMDGVR